MGKGEIRCAGRCQQPLRDTRVQAYKGWYSDEILFGMDGSLDLGRSGQGLIEAAEHDGRGGLDVDVFTHPGTVDARFGLAEDNDFPSLVTGPGGALSSIEIVPVVASAVVSADKSLDGRGAFLLMRRMEIPVT